MLRFVSTVDGIVTLDRAFNRIEEYISDFRSVWPSVTQEFYRIEAEQFASEGAAGASGKWTPLSPAYAKFKAVEFPGEPILQASHHMIESLTDPEALDAVFIPEPTQLTIGTRDPKALAHHRGRGRLPARPVISMSEAQKRRIQKAIQRELVEFTRRLGFQVREEAA